MILSAPLTARKPTVTASIFVKMDCFKVKIYFENNHQEEAYHTFKDEQTMFNYLEKFGLLREDFKLQPF